MIIRNFSIYNIYFLLTVKYLTLTHWHSVGYISSKLKHMTHYRYSIYILNPFVVPYSVEVANLCKNDGKKSNTYVLNVIPKEGMRSRY